jgi:hypothetical protein
MAFVLGAGTLRKCATFSNVALSTPSPPVCGPPDICLGQAVTLGSLILTITGVERWSGDPTAVPQGGQVFVTVLAQVSVNSQQVPGAAILDYGGYVFRVRTPTLIWYDLKPGVVREPALRAGVVSTAAPLVGWLTFELPATQASELRLAPIPGVYVRLY